MANCAYCGGWIKESGDKQMFKSLGKSLGLEIVGDAIGGVAKLAGNKKYCSKKCEEYAEGGVSASGNTQTVAKKAFWEPSENEVKARAADLDEISSLKELPGKFNFDGGVSEISTTLNDLFTKYASIPKGLEDMSLMAARKAAKTALLEKAEFGIMKLRKEDADMADFFQKKLDDIKNPKGKLGLFGKKK